MPKASELWKANAQGPYTARYLPMANLMLDQLTRGEARNLYRELNISNALSTVTYEADGVKYRRTSFISYPDQVMVIKIAADRPQAVSLHIRLNSLLRYTVQTKGEKTLILNGKAPPMLPIVTTTHIRWYTMTNGDTIQSASGTAAGWRSL